jgi:hypothetical protein
MGDTFAVMHSLEVRQPTTALIVGTGYIGLEMAENSFQSWLGWTHGPFPVDRRSSIDC